MSLVCSYTFVRLVGLVLCGSRLSNVDCINNGLFVLVCAAGLFQHVTGLNLLLVAFAWVESFDIHPACHSTAVTVARKQSTGDRWHHVCAGRFNHLRLAGVSVLTCHRFNHLRSFD